MTLRILLIKRAALGDILMATPLIRQLKQKMPDIELDFLVSQEFASVLKNNPYIDNLLTLPTPTFSIKKIFALICFAFSIRGKYDYVFILDKHYYFNFIGRIISKNTVGYMREFISWLFLRYRVRYDNVMRYHGLYYLDLLNASRLALPDYTDYKLDFIISAETVKNIEKILHEYKLANNNFVIIINSGGNNQFESGGIRMLPDDKAVQLINRAAADTKVILLGGAVDKIHYNNLLTETIGFLSGNIINLAGKLTLEQSALLMTYAHKVYTTDCGAMHLAVSTGIFDRIYCFFGPTCPNHILPPHMSIEYYWGDSGIFDKRYSLYGKVPKNNKYFTQLDIDKLFYKPILGAIYKECQSTGFKDKEYK